MKVLHGFLRIPRQKRFTLNQTSEVIEMKVRMTLILSLLLGSQLLSGCQSQPQSAAIGLHEAALTGNLEAIHHHIDAGSDLNMRDDYGSTPLIVASTFGKTAVARALMGAGAELEAANNDGSTPLHIASFLCYPDIVTALLEHGANPNATNSNGNTPLQGVAGSFEDVRPVYDAIGGALSPLGLRLDYDRIRSTRPVIADMLRAAAEPSGEPDVTVDADSSISG